MTRAQEILEVALVIGPEKLTRRGVARAVGVSESLINRYYPTLDDLVEAVVEAGVEREVLDVVLWGLVAGSPAAEKVGADLRWRALMSMWVR